MYNNIDNDKNKNSNANNKDNNDNKKKEEKEPWSQRASGGPDYKFGTLPRLGIMLGTALLFIMFMGIFPPIGIIILIIGYAIAYQ